MSYEGDVSSLVNTECRQIGLAYSVEGMMVMEVKARRHGKLHQGESDGE